MSLLINALKKDRSNTTREFSYNESTQTKAPSSFSIINGLVFTAGIGFVALAMHLFIAGSNTETLVRSSQPVEINKNVQMVKPVENGPQWQTNYHAALNYMERGEYADAISILDNEDMIRSTDGAAALQLANIYLKLGSVSAAQNTAKAALAMNTEANDDLIGMIGQTQYMQQQYQQALETLQKASPNIATHPAYYALMARSYIKLGQPLPAIELFSHILRQFPDEATWWIGIGIAYQEAGKMDSASDAYHKAAELNEDPQVGVYIEGKIRELNGSIGTMAS